MNNKIAIIKTNEKNFYKHWLTLTKPLHKLSNQKMHVISLFLYEYFKLKGKVDDNLIWNIVFSKEIRDKVRKEVGIKDQGQFNNLLTKLRKEDKVLINNRISNSFIPKLDLSQSNEFNLIYKFEING